MQQRSSTLALAAAAALLIAAPVNVPAESTLTGDQIRKLITGNTVTGNVGARPIEFSYTPKGEVYGTIGVNTDDGSWRIGNGNQYCHEWSEFFDGSEHCYQWRDLGGGRYRMVNVDADRDRDIDVSGIRPGTD